MSQATSVLKRDLSHVEPLPPGSLYGLVPREAASVLGYDTLERHEKSDRETNHLRRSLQNSGAQPFTEESVEEYKKEVVKQANPRFPFVNKILRVLTYVSAIATMLCAGPMVFGWLVSWRISAGFAAGFIVTFVVAGFLAEREIRQLGSWSNLSLRGCTEHVPSFALSLSIELKKAHPGAEFYIHHFVQGEVVRDIFLVLESGGKKYFIAVWEKPRFDIF